MSTWFAMYFFTIPAAAIAGAWLHYLYYKYRIRPDDRRQERDRARKEAEEMMRRREDARRRAFGARHPDRADGGPGIHMQRGTFRNDNS